MKSIMIYSDTSFDTEGGIVLARRLARKKNAYLIGVGLEAAAGAGERFTKKLRDDKLRGEFRLIANSPADYRTRHACAAHFSNHRTTQPGTPERSRWTGRRRAGLRSAGSRPTARAADPLDQSAC